MRDHSIDVASDCIDWMMRQASLPIRSRREAQELGEKLNSAGVIEHVCDPQEFKDAFLFFRFTVSNKQQTLAD